MAAGERAESKVPEGQPTPRLAWVERAIKRHRAAQIDPEYVRAAVERIPASRRDFYAAVIDEMQSAQAAGWRIVLDTGCGTGESTIHRRQPGQLILGMDKSIERLRRGLRRRRDTEQGLEPSSQNLGFASKASADDPPVTLLEPGASIPRRVWEQQALLLWGDVVEFWAMLFDRELQVDRMDFLYPNPWPKSQHFARRWQGHPGLMHALRVTREVELRSNWEIYVQEFAHALRCFYGDAVEIVSTKLHIDPADALTAFEAKYAESSHPLYRLCSSLRCRG